MNRGVAAAQSRPRRRLTSRVLRGAAVLVLLLAAVAAVGYWQLLSPARIADRAEATLAELTGGTATVASGQLQADGRLTLEQVRIDAPGLEGPGAEVFRAERIIVRLDPDALWWGGFEVEAVTLERPRLSMTEYLDEGVLNYQKLTPRQAGDTASLKLPAITVQQGVIQHREVQAGRLVERGRLNLAGRLTADAKEPDVFRLELEERRGVAGPAPPLTVRGWFNLRTMEAEARLTGLQLSEQVENLLPSNVRQIWRRFDPAGALPTIIFAYDTEGPWAIRAEFSDVAMTLPQLNEAEAERRFRMTGVKGAFRFEPDRVVIAEPLVGRIENLEYEVQGEFGGYSADAPFDLAVRTKPFEISEKPEYSLALPRPVQDLFRLFRPNGTMRLSSRVWRGAPTDSGEGAEPARIEYEGVATILTGRGRFEEFPYELRKARGRVSFDRDEIRVLNLTGEISGGGRLMINGTIAPPGPEPAVNLDVTAVNLPFDEALYNALEAKHRPAMDLFFFDPQYERLVELGHVMPIEQYNAGERRASTLRQQLKALGEAADGETASPRRQALEQELTAVRGELDRPAFELGGRADALVRVTRTEGPGDRTFAVTELNLKEANVVFRYFPYPLRITGGTIRIEPGLITLDHVMAEGLHGGEGRIDGTVRIPSRVNKLEKVYPDIEIRAVGLPMVDALFDALPAEHATWIRRLDPAGRVHVKGRIFADANGDPNIDVTLDMRDVLASANAEGKRMVRLGGEVHVTLDDADLSGLTATLGRTTFDFEGGASWQGGVPSIDLVAEARDMTLEPAALEFISTFADVDPAWRDWLDRHQVTARFDARVSLTDANADAPLDAAKKVSIELRPHALGFVRDDRTVEFRQIQGRLISDGRQVSIERVAAPLDGGRIEIGGGLTLEPTFRADLTMAASAEAIGEQAKGLLPTPLSSLIEKLSIDGRYEARLDRLTWRPGVNATSDATGEPPRDPPGIAVRGRVALTDGRLDLAAPVRDVQGTLTFQAQSSAGRAWPEVTFGLKADRLTIAGRSATEFEAEVESVDGQGGLTVSKLRSKMHGGAVGGHGRVLLDEKHYEFHLAVSDVDFAEFLTREPQADEPARPEPRVAAEEAEMRLKGRLSAALDLEGRWNEPGSVRGRGVIQVREGRMYDLPLSLGLLQVTHLSLPTESSFERALVSYYLQDGVVSFDRIRLENDSVRLAGEGRMDYNSQELDLTLTTSNPTGLKLGPLTDLIDGVRNQFVTIRVTGSLDQPQTEVKQLNSLTEAWGDVFGSEEEQNR